VFYPVSLLLIDFLELQVKALQVQQQAQCVLAVQWMLGGERRDVLSTRLDT